MHIDWHVAVMIVCLQACAALDVNEAANENAPSSKCVLKVLRLGEHVMHFAYNSKAGIMACVSLLQPLQDSVAAAFTQVSFYVICLIINNPDTPLFSFHLYPHAPSCPCCSFVTCFHNPRWFLAV